MGKQQNTYAALIATSLKGQAVLTEIPNRAPHLFSRSLEAVLKVLIVQT